MTVFSPDWFVINQRKLQYIANTPILGREILHLLSIKRNTGQVVQITPNSITFLKDYNYLNEPIYQQSLFINNLIENRLRKEFNPIWKLLHGWDTKFANRLIPALNLGFDTFIPDTGNPGTTSVNAYIQNSASPASTSWSNLHNNTTGNFTGSPTNGPLYIINSSSDFPAAPWIRILRSFFHFDASALPAGTIASAKIVFSGTAKTDTLLGGAVGVYQSTAAANNQIVNGDYDQLGTILFSNKINTADFSIVGDNEFLFNATGLATISAAVLKYGFREANWDAPNVEPTWADTVTSRVDGDFAAGTNPVELIITFTTPSPTNTIPIEVNLGGLTSLVQNNLYVLPPVRAIILSDQDLEISNDTSFTDIETVSAQAFKVVTGGFLRCTAGDALVSLKRY